MNINQSHTLLKSALIFYCCFMTTNAAAQAYLEMRQDQLIFDVDVVVFARQLSQPAAEMVVNKDLIKDEAVVVLPYWDGETALMTFPEVIESADDTVPIESQANPVNVLSDVILSTSMNHPIINRLANNPTYKPIYRQKWRQLPSPFLRPRYIEVSNLKDLPVYQQSNLSLSVSKPTIKNMTDYSIDGQVAFSKQRFTHLHIKMNLIRINADDQQIIYELSQQKRIELNQWQYFDHQQFGVLAKVSTVKLTKHE